MIHDAPWHNTELTLSERVKALMEVMTLEEKLAQLGSFWEETPDGGDGGDVAPMEEAMRAGASGFDAAIRHGLGHLTRPFGTAPIEAAAGVRALNEKQRQVVASHRLGIGAIAHEECLTGFTTLGATVYPTSLAWAATFEPDLIEHMAEQIGADMRSVGIHQGLAPVLDVVRDYRWGRVEETMGEDPYLVATTGTAYVKGLQRTGLVATLKHFAGYSASRAARNHAPVSMGPRELADIILPPFEMAIREGLARSVMNAYTDIDGVPSAADTQLLTDLLRTQWGFEGTVVSDYYSIAFLDMMHRVTADRQASGVAALEAGIDVELPGSNAYPLIIEAVNNGDLRQEIVDRAVRRVLIQKAELGLLDKHQAAVQEREHVDLDPPQNRALAREIAEHSIILLQNDGILPLEDLPRNIALVGPTADRAGSLLGCYSFPNHVLSRSGITDPHLVVPTIKQALVEQFPNAHLQYREGVPIREDDLSGIPDAVNAARTSDLCVVSVGDFSSLFGEGTSGEGCDACDLRLPGRQHELVEAVLATGTPTILVVVSGRPYALGDYVDRCAGIVQAFLPGEEGAHAIARVLNGSVNPSGHCPVSIPRYAGGGPGTYLAPPLGHTTEGVSNIDVTALFPFGHGCSYTSFEYSGLTLSSEAIDTQGFLEASVVVTNTGKRTGADVVQLYLSDETAQVTRPVRELIGYCRVDLEPGQSVQVSFSVHADRTSFTGREGFRIVEPGAFRLGVGYSSGDIASEASFELTGKIRPAGTDRVLTTPVTLQPVRDLSEEGARLPIPHS